jgi:hypothetical protein
MTCIGAALLISWGLVWATVGMQEPKVNPEALVLQDFKQRIDKYMELHKQLEKDAPPLKKTDDPAKIKASQDALATAILAARAGAKQGDIFTPEIAQRFKSLMYPELKGQKGVVAKETIKEDAPPPMALKVNMRYPEKSPLPTVPPNLLANLPQLPEDLEYRIVGNALILRDVHANLVIDFIPRAIR